MEDSIIVYSSPTCPKCKMLKLELAKKGVEYQDYNIDADPEKARELGIMQSPTLSVNGELLGFKEAIDWVKRH